MPKAKKSRKNGGNSVTGELRDLPSNTPNEWAADRKDTFDRAWAQRRARESMKARAVFPLQTVPATKAPPTPAPKSASDKKAELAALSSADSDSD